MSDWIPHDCDLSPLTERIRLALGPKELTWRSVDTPTVLGTRLVQIRGIIERLDAMLALHPSTRAQLDDMKNVAAWMARIAEIAVHRSTDRTGDVHFPREDYALVATG